MIQTKHPRAEKTLEVFVRDQEILIQSDSANITLEGDAAARFMANLQQNMLQPLGKYVEYQQQKVSTGATIVPPVLIDVANTLEGYAKRLKEVAAKADKKLKVVPNKK